jgi:hypothetical protein
MIDIVDYDLSKSISNNNSVIKMSNQETHLRSICVNYYAIKIFLTGIQAGCTVRDRIVLNVILIIIPNEWHDDVYIK